MTTPRKFRSGGAHVRNPDGTITTIEHPTRPRTKADWDREREERNRAAEPATAPQEPTHNDEGEE